eukprot:TRINITY_DN89_c0_g3_i1.p1 TRINITY_DN89_c0_g3~~TRINITY_DN89_c0_g3_i1.p1  ORF type:complete len:339 (+),score=56.97 TRINITY_DN89_c0_g3_i1:85-1101(+)
MSAAASSSTSSTTEFQLSSPPSDGISTVKFAHKSDLLLISSWDNTVRLYNTTKNELLNKYEEHKGAVLDCTFSADDAAAFSGGLDKNVIMTDIKSGKSVVLGSHKQAVRCVEYHAPTGMVISGGWDCTINLWDPRSHQPLTASYTNSGCKVYTMAQAGQRLVVGTSGRQVYIYDVRNMAKPEQVRESSLTNQTRCIRCFNDQTGYALSSIEGRVAIEYFDLSPMVQKKKYAFKCHRKTMGKTQVLYPVNSIAFHPIFGTFATGGCDGIINIWDGFNKKRICLYPAYQTSIASLDFNSTGSLLAIAASYTYEEGEKDHPADAIYIRTVSEHEVKPKIKL